MKNLWKLVSALLLRHCMLVISVKIVTVIYMSTSTLNGSDSSIQNLVSCFRSRWLCCKRLWCSETQYNNQPTYSNKNINPTMLHITYFSPDISLCILFLMFCKHLPASLCILWKLTPHAEIVIPHDQCGFWHNPATSDNTFCNHQYNEMVCQLFIKGWPFSCALLSPYTVYAWNSLGQLKSD